MLTDKLLPLLEGDKERVGFVLQSGEIVEVQNISPAPESSFDVSVDDLIKYDGEAIATWHTHPKAPSNLSVDDYSAFLNWPNLKHFVIGTDGVQCFVVKDNRIVKDVAV